MKPDLDKVFFGPSGALVSASPYLKVKKLPDGRVSVDFTQPATVSAAAPPPERIIYISFRVKIDASELGDPASVGAPVVMLYGESNSEPYDFDEIEFMPGSYTQVGEPEFRWFGGEARGVVEGGGGGQYLTTSPVVPDVWHDILITLQAVAIDNTLTLSLSVDGVDAGRLRVIPETTFGLPFHISEIRVGASESAIHNVWIPRGGSDFSKFAHDVDQLKIGTALGGNDLFDAADGFDSIVGSDVTITGANVRCDSDATGGGSVFVPFSNAYAVKYVDFDL